MMGRDIYGKMEKETEILLEETIGSEQGLSQIG